MWSCQGQEYTTNFPWVALNRPTCDPFFLYLLYWFNYIETIAMKNVCFKCVLCARKRLLKKSVLSKFNLAAQEWVVYPQRLNNHKDIASINVVSLLSFKVVTWNYLYWFKDKCISCITLFWLLTVNLWTFTFTGMQ